MKDFENIDYFEDIADENTLADALNKNIVREISQAQSDKHTFVFSKQHKKRMKKLLRTENVTVSRPAPQRPVISVLRRVSIAAAIVLVFLNAAFLSSVEVRAAVEEAFVQWFGSFTSFGNQSDSGDVKGISDYHLAYLPEGFELVSGENTEGINFTLYANADGKTLSFSCVSASDSLSVNNQKKLYYTITENGITYHTFTAIDTDLLDIDGTVMGDELEGYTFIPTVENKTCSVIWEMDGFIFSVEGELPLTELLKAAKSVTK